MSYPWQRLRSAHYDAIYVSPHMDDAVYSCGGQIAQQRDRGERVLVLTVFGNGRQDEQGSGVFGDIAQRKREERAAMDALDIDHLWLNLPDLIVRGKSPLQMARAAIPFAQLGPNALQRELAATVEALRARLLAPGGSIYFPLGVGAHPDHRLVFEVGCAFVADPMVWFYEDVPYAQVPALRDERLYQLGLASARWSGSRAVHDFALPHAPGWQQPFTRTLVFSWWTGTQLLARMRRGTARAKQQRELAISDVIARKVSAMRAYATQTAFFYPAGDAMYERLSRAGEHYVERYWQLDNVRAPAALSPAPALIEREMARLESALRMELQRA